MRFEGRIDKQGKYWLVDIPALDAQTQGHTKREALAMAEDLVESMANTEGFRAHTYPTGRNSFEIEANDVGILIALLLRRQRERQGLTLSQAAQRLGQSSPNAYARYEQAQVVPSVVKLEELLRAIAPNQRIVWRLAA